MSPPSPRYIFGSLLPKRGRTRSPSTPVVAVLTCSKDTHMWSCRSTCPSRLNHDYIHGRKATTIENVEEWLSVDLMPGYHIILDREEALEHLASHWTSWAAHPDWFLKGGDPTQGPDEAAERALRHLETGW